MAISWILFFALVLAMVYDWFEEEIYLTWYAGLAILVFVVSRIVMEGIL